MLSPIYIDCLPLNIYLFYFFSNHSDFVKRAKIAAKMAKEKAKRSEADKLKPPSDSVHAHPSKKDENNDFRSKHLHLGEDVSSCTLSSLIENLFLSISIKWKLNV
jgi:hypothetical protein